MDGSHIEAHFVRVQQEAEQRSYDAQLSLMLLKQLSEEIQKREKLEKELEEKDDA